MSEFLKKATIFVSCISHISVEEMHVLEQLRADVLSRCHFHTLNNGPENIEAYKPEIEECRERDMLFVTCLQAANMTKDPNLFLRQAVDRERRRRMGHWMSKRYPIPKEQFEDFACRNLKGETLGEARGRNGNFAHPCLNNPRFIEFLKKHIRILVDGGVDGIHIDETMTRYFGGRFGEGYCHSCMSGMREYLKAKYTPEQLKEMYGIKNIEDFDLCEKLKQDGFINRPEDHPLHKEWWLFQISAETKRFAELYGYLKSYAKEKYGKDLITTGNVYEPEHLPSRAVEAPFIDYVMIGSGMTIRYRREGKPVEEVRMPPKYSYVPSYRMARALTPEKPVTFFVDVPGGGNLYRGLPPQVQRDYVRWLFAEAYSVGAFFSVPYSHHLYGPLDICVSYAQFLKRNEGLYHDVEPCSDVAVLYSFASSIWDRTRLGGEVIHWLQYYGICEALQDMNVQYDVAFMGDGEVLPDKLTVEDLLRHKVLLVPWCYSLSNAQVKKLKEYAYRGGRLVVAGKFATLDEGGKPREKDVRSDLKDAGAVILPDLDFEPFLEGKEGKAVEAIRDSLKSVVGESSVHVSAPFIEAFLNRKGNDLHCHLVNMDYGEYGFDEKKDVKVRIRVPDGLDLEDRQVILLSPDREPERLEYPREFNAGTSIGASGLCAFLLPAEQKRSPPIILSNKINGSILEVSVPEIKVYSILKIVKKIN